MVAAVLAVVLADEAWVEAAELLEIPTNWSPLVRVASSQVLAPLLVVAQAPWSRTQPPTAAPLQ